MTKSSINHADRLALDKLVAASPEWSGQDQLGSLIECSDNVLLHAGPAFSQPSTITMPILNSARVAAVYQGIAKDFDDAREKIMAEEIKLEPAQNYSVVTPLASVVSMAMPVHIVRDRNDHLVQAYAPINGGGGPAIRLGICSDVVLHHLQWLNGAFNEQLSTAFSNPISLIEIATASLKKGDDCHGRTIEATAILSKAVSASMDNAAREFLKNGPSFFLNLWMAAVKCMFRAAEGVTGSSLVTTAGANGIETGIQVSGLPGQWFTHQAQPPHGALDVEVSESRKLGAIGDSAVVDGFGLGAMAMNLAPAQKAGLGPYMPEGGLTLPQDILGAVHPGFGDLGLKVGTLAARVVQSKKPPVVSLGVLDNTGELGRLGGGIFVQPLSIFIEAVSATRSARPDQCGPASTLNE